MRRIHRRSRAARSAEAPSRPPAWSAAGACARARAPAPHRWDEFASVQHLSGGDPQENVVQIRTPDAPGRSPRGHLRLQPGNRGDVLVATAEVRYVALAQPGPELRLERSGQAVEIRPLDLQHVPPQPLHPGARRAGFHEPALADERDAVAAVGLFQVVRGEQYRHAGPRAQPLDEAPDAAAVRQIEADRRLVEEKDAGLVQDPADDIARAAHAAR